MRCQDCPFPNHRCMTKELPPAHEVDIVIVGEAPGSQEISKNEAFTGPSGDLLKTTLVKYDLKGRSFYITNALMCRPPQGKANAKTPIEACKGRLHKELELVKSKVILALGATAAKAVTDDHSIKITQVAGRTTSAHGRPVVMGVHPAAVLRAPETYKLFSSAVSKASEIINGTAQKIEKPRYVAIENVDDFDRALTTLSMSTYLACDIETEGLDPLSRKIITLGIGWEEGKVAIFPARMIPDLKKLLESERHKFIWHNGKFDVQFLHQMGIKARCDEDVMLMHYAQNELKGTHDLEQLACNDLGAEPYEKAAKKYLDKEWGYKWAPRSVLDPYLACDVAFTYALFFKYEKVLRASAGEGLYYVYKNILMKGSDLLIDVEKNGIEIDPIRLAETRDRLSEDKRDMLSQIAEIVDPLWDSYTYTLETGAKKCPDQFNPGSSQQLGWLLYDKMKLRTSVRNTQEDTLNEIKDKHSLIPLIMKLRKTNKLISTYVEGIQKRIRKDGKLHSSFLLHGTVTGRLASRDPNLQNIPRGSVVKNMFIPSRDKLFLEVDYRGAELRCLALLSKDPDLIQIFKDGRDLHDEVSIAMYGEGFTRDQRVRAKAVNFGIAYGRGANSLAEEFGISFDEAQGIVNAWFNRFPIAKSFIFSTRAKVKRGEIITSALGRQRRHGLVTERNVYAVENEAINFPIQSLASDFTLISAGQLNNYFKAHRNCTRILNLVHDSILFEVGQNPDEIREVAKVIEKVMCSIPSKLLGSKVPFEVEFKVGPSWGEVKEVGWL